jgi:hypothetical protein
MAVILLARYAAAGSIQHLIEAPALMPIQSAIVLPCATFKGLDSALLINESTCFPPRQLSAANAVSNPFPLEMFTSIDTAAAVAVALRQAGHRNYPADYHCRNKKSKQSFLHNVSSLLFFPTATSHARGAKFLSSQIATTRFDSAHGRKKTSMLY